MFQLKRFVRSSGAAIALAAACLSTSAHADFRGMSGWGFGGPVHNGPGGPINNGPGGPINNGLGGVGSVGGFRGIGGPGQHFGLNPYGAWGMSPQQNVGFGPFGQSLGVGPENNGWGVLVQRPPIFGVGPDNNGWGVSGGSAIYNAMFGINPYSSFGWGPLGLGISPQQAFCANCRPSWFGFNPEYSFGMDPQQNVGFINPWMGMSPQQNVGFINPWMGMNPNGAMPAQPVSMQQGGLQGVQCTINGVGVLTKDADDCEHADGEVVKAKPQR
jgi:hypothetical protein